ncbi:DUF3052 domain-containing protein [Luethyella okanaganae]|uniref:DUF3052 domain-containing protein n=1 Tax=Luethyella okanaganae TaxID=69372 RepID=A0ABW1VGU9_9MICO
MTGYSGTPLWKKLGLTDESIAQLVHAPSGWQVPDAPAVRWLPTEADKGEATHLLAFYREPADYLHELPKLAERIHPDGCIWVAWPRKATGHVSAMTENIVRDGALELGLVDIKVAALDDAWSGLKIVWRRHRSHHNPLETA